MRISALASLGSFLALSLTSSVAVSAQCDRQSKHVSLAFSENWNAAAREAVLSDLAGALNSKNIDACPLGDEDDQAVAAIVVTLVDSTVTIEVDDHLTNKKVARDVTLRDAKDSSSALLVAVAIDELLRATWAELSLPKTDVEEPEPEPVFEPPAPPKKQAAVLPLHRVALRGSVESYVLASTFWGGDVVFGSSFENLLEYGAFAGPRLVRASAATDLGDVRADAVTFGLEIGLPVVATQRFFFGPQLSLAATHAWFQGEPSEGIGDAFGERISGWGLLARAGLFGRLHLGPASLGLASRVGAPLARLEVTDGREVIGGMSGLEWSNSVTLGWWWSR